MTERIRDLAHVGGVELFTPVLEQSVDFFVRLMALDEVARVGDSVYLHSWDDYESWTVKLTARPEAGVGRTYLRAASAAALERRAAAVEATGRPGRWVRDEPNLGPIYLCSDPDGHDIALKNQAAPFPGRGANVRRLDHVNYLAEDVPACSAFTRDVLAGRATEQIVMDDGSTAAIWYTFSDKSYDAVYTHDWAGARGRLHHVAFATDTRDDILRAADVFLEAGVHIETGPHKHAIQQTFFLYVWEPGGNRIELCNAGARLVLAPDWELISWTQRERAKGQAWGLKTIESFHTHGTPVIAGPGDDAVRTISPTGSPSSTGLPSS